MANTQAYKQHVITTAIKTLPFALRFEALKEALYCFYGFTTAKPPSFARNFRA